MNKKTETLLIALANHLNITQDDCLERCVKLCSRMHDETLKGKKIIYFTPKSNSYGEIKF
ncbi:MAG: hypothetical protein RLZZ139_4113 [Cyanobacteriota bacterium]|jgi:hypothetical protein